MGDMIFAFCVGIVIGLFLGIMLGLLFPPDLKMQSIYDLKRDREEAIESGQALYCPKTGIFAMIGEC